MKTTQQPLINVRKEILDNLCKEIKETIAKDVSIKTQHPFGVADLWKIHRNTRYRAQRRTSLF